MYRVAIQALLYGSWTEIPPAGYVGNYGDYTLLYRPGSSYRVDGLGHTEVFTRKMAMYVFDRLFERIHSGDDSVVTPFGYSPEYCVHGCVPKQRDCWIDQQESAYFMPFYTAIETGEPLTTGIHTVGCMNFYVTVVNHRVHRVNHQVFVPSDHDMLIDVSRRFESERKMDPLRWGSEDEKMTDGEVSARGC